MEMEFVRHEPCYDRILFVLTLDRKKMKERILIEKEFHDFSAEKPVSI